MTTLPSWPGGVPYASITSGLDLGQLDTAPIGTDMNAGTTRYRRTTTLRIATQTVAVVMTADQFATLKAFHDSLGAGAARFTMPVWDGLSHVVRTVQFKTQPSMKPHAYRKRLVSFELRIENL